MTEETMVVIRDASGDVINIGPWEHGVPLFDWHEWPNPDQPGETVTWQTPRLDENGNQLMSNPLPAGATEGDEIVVINEDGSRHVKGDYSAYPVLTRRQFRLGLLAGGIAASSVTAALNEMLTGEAKEKALIEWESAETYQRTHPLIASVGQAMSLTNTQIDTMWLAAAAL